MKTLENEIKIAKILGLKELFEKSVEKTLVKVCLGIGGTAAIELYPILSQFRFNIIYYLLLLFGLLLLLSFLFLEMRESRKLRDKYGWTWISSNTLLSIYALMLFFLYSLGALTIFFGFNQTKFKDLIVSVIIGIFLISLGLYSNRVFIKSKKEEVSILRACYGNWGYIKQKFKDYFMGEMITEERGVIKVEKGKLKIFVQRFPGSLMYISIQGITIYNADTPKQIKDLFESTCYQQTYS